MNNLNASVKDLVKEKYGEIASQSDLENRSSCCGAGGCSTEVYNIMTDDYSKVEGYNADADLGLGCGVPTQFARIRKGDVVVDLGSGAGNDCFVARHEAGESGKVIGIDFTPAMINRARENAAKLGYENVEFRQGDIEKMPLTANTADVVISNCVLNLVPDKRAVFSEIVRVLKPGGHFSISDIVLQGSLPDNLRNAAEMYAGCVSGAVQKTTYLELITQQGFKGITVQKEKDIVIPDDILSRYLSPAELQEFKTQGSGIQSVTVYAEKPAAAEPCCGPGCCN
jgi:arsenite methyltransferase